MDIELAEETSPRITDIVAVIGLIVSILVAATSLLSNFGNLPSWWFFLSLFILIALMISMPIMIFMRPIREITEERMLQRKLDRISRKYTPKLKDLVIKSRAFIHSIRSLLDGITNYYQGDIIKSRLAAYTLGHYNRDKAYNEITNVEREIDESNKTYRNLCLLMERFESILDTYKNGLEVYQVFAHEMMNTTDKPIAKGLEAEYEAFREKYNDFLKDVTDFCHNINQETGRHDFPEHSFEYLKKL